MTGDDRDEVVLDELPGLGGLYVRGARRSALLAARRGRAARPLPPVAHRLDGVRTAGLADRLRAFQRVVGEPGSDRLSAAFQHVLAFPVALTVMTREDFPLPLVGMVHLANDVTTHRPVRLGDVIEIRAWAESLRPHRRGAQVDIVAEISVATPDGAELAWRGASTYLAKGFSVAGDAPEPSATGEWEPPLPTARWRLASSIGRAYAAVSGDRNPIHTSSLAARAFGFPGAIAHGMFLAARAAAATGAAGASAIRWTVEFAKPVVLPATVDVAVEPDGDGSFAYTGWRARRGSRHFTGRVDIL